MLPDRNLSSVDGDSASARQVTHITMTPDAIRDQVKRILSDSLFHNSKRYSNLLRFVVERTLEGDHESLKERLIGIQVFDRAVDYDPGLDAIVRVAATEVRKRLNLYYNELAHEYEIRVHLPTRSYVAEFSVPKEKQKRSFMVPWRRWYLLVLLGAAIMALAGWGAYRLLIPTPAIDLFWAPIVNYSGPIFVSVSSLPQEEAAPADNPIIAGSAATGTTIRSFKSQLLQIVPRGDLRAAIAITSFLGNHGRECEALFAKTTTLEEMKGRPVIVFGSFDNRWAVRLGTDLHFRLKNGERKDGLAWIEDSSNPQNRNWSKNGSAPYDGDRTEYALVTRAMSQTTGQWWIGISGLSGIGTRAAQQMLLDPNAMAALGSRLPKGWEHKNLQVVLAIKVVKESPGATQLLTTYSW